MNKLRLSGLLIFLASSSSIALMGIITAKALPTSSATASPLTQITQLETAPSSFPSDQHVIFKADIYLSKLAKARLFSGSVLIARNGNVLVRKGYGEAARKKHLLNTAQTKFRLGSITKQFTAMAILILQARGKLNVQDRICTYLADCPTTWQQITIHHLLTHTSGIPDFTSFPDFKITMRSPSSSTETIARFKDKPLAFQPGEKFNYSNSIPLFGGHGICLYLLEWA
jgi:CubicO group peptidase (beta-lactamase class C family)